MTERIKYKIKGVDSIKDIKDKKDFYKVANDCGAVFFVSHDFIEQRFNAIRIDQVKYFAYMDSPFLLNGMFKAVGTADIGIDLQLIRL